MISTNDRCEQSVRTVGVHAQTPQARSPNWKDPMLAQVALLIPAMWALWLLYWVAAAWHAKRTLKRESVLSRVLHIGPLVLAAWMLNQPQLPWPWLVQRWLPWNAMSAALCVSLTAAGLALAVWARVHIGSNWSGTVTLKHDHALVRTGPYRWVRHPIYSGLLLAIAASGMARGDLRGLLALLIVWLALWRKWRLEERWMVECFGPAYRAYQEQVGAVVPRWR